MLLLSELREVKGVFKPDEQTDCRFILEARVTAGKDFAGLLCNIIGFGEYIDDDVDTVDVVVDDVGFVTLPIEEYFSGAFLIIDFNDVGVEDGLKGFAKFLFNANGEGFV